MVISAHYVTCSKVFPSVLSHAFMPSVPHCTGNCSVTIYWDGTCRLRHHQGSFFFFPGRFTSTRVFRTLLLLTRSGATHGILTLQCLYGTKCFQGCTTAGTCKCLVCALLLWGVYFFAALIASSVYESISPVVVLSLFAAQACIVALVCVS